MTDNSLEAKICVLGSQGVGKTCLVQRYVTGKFSPSTTLSTVGASFYTKRIIDIDSGTVVRLQLWDTAGQERFRSISPLYYRGASAVILVYSIIDEKSFEDMGQWLHKVKQNMADDAIIHVVGTKADLADEERRAVPFERCIAYVADNMHQAASTSPVSSGSSIPPLSGSLTPNTNASNRNSTFWGQDMAWDVCHEISASSGEGIEEVFRVVTRKLVERKMKMSEEQPSRAHTGAGTGGEFGVGNVHRSNAAKGSFRLGERRRSWLGFPSVADEQQAVTKSVDKTKRGPCC